MAFLVCYSTNPPKDHTRDRAIYLDQSFYKLIYEHCRGLEAGYATLGTIAALRYKSPTLVVNPDSLKILACELNRLSDNGHLHSQIPDLCVVVDTALKRNCSLTISGDMYPEL